MQNSFKCKFMPQDHLICPESGCNLTVSDSNERNNRFNASNKPL